MHLDLGVNFDLNPPVTVMSSSSSPTVGSDAAGANASTESVLHPLGGIPPEIVTVTDLVRTGVACTRQTIAERTGMGRNTVSTLVSDAVDLGLLTPNGSAPSTGGRAPAMWRFHHEAGGTFSLGVHTATLRLAVTDLAGNELASRIINWPITSGPDKTLERAATDLLALTSQTSPPIWCAGVSLTGPIDHRTGRPAAPPIMPGWDDFDVVGTLEHLLGVRVTVDNDVNAMLAGYVSNAAPLPHRLQDLLYVQIGTGIGASLFSNRTAHRGADGAAGDIGHVRVTDSDTIVCRCGRTGCLEAIAGGWAVLRDARRAAAEGLSPFLRERLTRAEELTITDLVDGVTAGDTECVTLMVRSATAVGDALAMLVSFFNPGRVVLAGPMPQGCPMFLEVARRIVDERALGLATRDLELVVTDAGLDDERRGAAILAVQELFASALA